MCSGGSKAPPPPPALPEAPRAPDQSNEESFGDSDRKRRAAARGDSSTSTILTGPRGVQNGAATAAKTLLGG